MANVNKVMLIGRLTRDPEVRSFTNGGKVAKFGFAVSNRKKNTATGQWEDEPMFIDCQVYNRGEFGKQADLVEQSLRKGQQVFLEGHLVLEQWDDKQSGQKRSKHALVVDNFQFLEPRQDGGGGMGEGGSRPAQQRQSGYAAKNSGMNSGMDSGGHDDQDFSSGPGSGPPDDNIPF